MDIRFSRPLSPHDEGFRTGITTNEADDHQIRVDGESYMACDMSQDAHAALFDRPDFLEGVGKGIALRRELHYMGLSVSVYISFQDELNSLIPEEFEEEARIAKEAA